MSEAYGLMLQGKRRVIGTLNLVHHADFDDTIQALTIMRELVQQPKEPTEGPPMVPGGADAIAALTH